MKEQRVIRKWIKMMEAVLCTVSVLTCCFVTVPASETDSAVDYSSMPEYSSYAEVIEDTAATYDKNGNYALYDIDQDGTKELIISFGESDADWTNYVYTLEMECHNLLEIFLIQYCYIQQMITMEYIVSMVIWDIRKWIVLRNRIIRY